MRREHKNPSAIKPLGSFATLLFTIVVAGGCGAPAVDASRDQCKSDKAAIVQKPCQDQQSRCVLFARGAFAQYCRSYKDACEQVCRVESGDEAKCAQ